MRTHDNDRFEIEVRLRRDAATWGGEVTPELRARLHALTTPPPRRRLAWAAAAAAVVLLGATLAITWPRRQAPPPMLPRIDMAQLEAMALAPLKQELAFLVQDGRAVARGMLRGLWPQDQ